MSERARAGFVGCSGRKRTGHGATTLLLAVLSGALLGAGRARAGWEPAKALDLFRNRPALYEYSRGGLVIRAGGPGFGKFVEGTWKNPWILGQAFEGRSAALVYRRRGRIFLPPASELFQNRRAGSRWQLLVRVAPLAVPQAMTVRLGRRLLGTVALRPGWQEVRFDLDGVSWRQGPNPLDVTFRRVRRLRGVQAPDWRATGMYWLRRQRKVLSAAALDVVAIVPTGATVPANSPFDLKSRKIRLLDGGLRYYTVPPAGAFLEVQWKGSGTLELRWTSEGGKTISLDRWPGSPGPSTRRADLSHVAARPGRLDLVCRGSCILDRLVLGGRPTRQVTASRGTIQYVFLWVADTLRRDCVGAYGSRIVRTPNLDAFARRAALFERSIIQGNHSLPSHASILTGTYPPVHTLETSRSRVRGRLLWEVFRRAGWWTGLYSANGYVSRKWGYGRGLDRYVNFIRMGMKSDAEYVWRRVHRDLRRLVRRRKPVFMYILTIDPHVTYRPPTKYLKMYYPGRYRGPVPRRVTGFDLERIIRGQIPIRTADDLRYLKSLYYAEVTYNDHWFGRFLEDLRQLGIADRSLVVVTSDHGDEFRDHGGFGHARNLYQENIAVPLVIGWPGLSAGVRRRANVEVMDVFSTVLDLVSLPVPAAAQSASLLPRIRGGRPEFLSEAFSFHGGSLRSITQDRYKYIVDSRLGRQLYDLAEDPGEKRNLAGSRPLTLQLLRTYFGLKNTYVHRWRKAAWGLATDLTEAFSRDVSPR